MKHFFYLFVLLPFVGKAQYFNEITSWTAHYSYLVGSLPPVSAENYAKLQVDIFGGNWYSNTLGITTYYIANRTGLVINQTTMDGNADNFTIKAYSNPNGNTDIYIVVTTDYPAFAIKSCMLQGDATKLQTIVQQTPTGTDITPTVNPIFITDQSGSIGIGTFNTSSYKLSVNGNIRTKEINVTTSGWPDYVFDKDYKSPPLDSLSAQIKALGHLPNMPSAEEVEAKGLSLGDISKKQQQKIEELTLYVIGEYEKNKKLAARMQQFESAMQKAESNIQKLEAENNALKQSQQEKRNLQDKSIAALQQELQALKQQMKYSNL